MADEIEDPTSVTRRSHERTNKQEPVIKGVLPDAPAPVVAPKPEPVAGGRAACRQRAGRCARRSACAGGKRLLRLDQEPVRRRAGTGAAPVAPVPEAPKPAARQGGRGGGDAEARAGRDGEQRRGGRGEGRAAREGEQRRGGRSGERRDGERREARAEGAAREPRPARDSNDRRGGRPDRREGEGRAASTEGRSAAAASRRAQVLTKRSHQAASALRAAAAIDANVAMGGANVGRMAYPSRPTR